MYMYRQGTGYLYMYSTPQIDMHTHTHTEVLYLHRVGEEYGKDVLMLTLYGSLERSEPDRVLRVRISVIVQ